MTDASATKLELHLHLEGAAPPDFVRSLAKEKNVDLDGIFAEDGGYAYTDFWDFLRVYEAATSVLTSPEDYARLTKTVLEQSAQAGVLCERSASHIAEGVQQLFSDYPNRNDTRAYAQQFDWQSTSDGQLAIFNEIIQRQGTV